MYKKKSRSNLNSWYCYSYLSTFLLFIQTNLFLSQRFQNVKWYQVSKVATTTTVETLEKFYTRTLTLYLFLIHLNGNSHFFFLVDRVNVRVRTPNFYWVRFCVFLKVFFKTWRLKENGLWFYFSITVYDYNVKFWLVIEIFKGKLCCVFQKRFRKTLIFAKLWQWKP